MFLKSWIEMGGFELNHHWHGINVLSVLECCLLAALLCAMLGLLARRVRQSRRLRLAAVIGSLFFATAAYAANTALSALSASGALAGANLIYVVQTVGVGGVKATMTQVATFINSLFSGDATVSSGGTVTFATVNGNVGSFGSTTQCVSVTVNAKGLVTAVSAAACAPPFTAVTGRTTLAQLPQGIANSIWVNPTGSTADMTNVAVPACANDGAHGLVYVNGTGLQCASITAGVSSTTGGIGITCSPTTGAVVCSAPATTTNNTGTTDTITSANKGTIVSENNAASVAVAITTAGFVSTDYFSVKNKGAGVATYTPSSGTIDGAATLVCKQNQSADITFDGTNYWTQNSTCGLGTASVAATGTSGHTLPFLDGNNAHSGVETFGSVLGTVTTQSGTTYTFAAADCGTTVRFTNASAVTATIPQGLTVGCSIAVEQAGAGQVAVNGSAVTPATLHSAHSYTKTFAQWGIIGIFTESSNVAVLTGDGA